MGELNRFQMSLMLCKAMIMFEKRCTLNSLALALTKKYVLDCIALLMWSIVYIHLVRLWKKNNYSVMRHPNSHPLLTAIWLLSAFLWRLQSGEHSVLCFRWEVAISAGRGNIPSSIYAAHRPEGAQVQHVQYGAVRVAQCNVVEHSFVQCCLVLEMDLSTPYIKYVTEHQAKVNRLRHTILYYLFLYFNINNVLHCPTFPLC